MKQLTFLLTFLAVLGGTLPFCPGSLYYLREDIIGFPGAAAPGFGLHPGERIIGGHHDGGRRQFSFENIAKTASDSRRQLYRL